MSTWKLNIILDSFLGFHFIQDLYVLTACEVVQRLFQALYHHVILIVIVFVAEGDSYCC